MRARREFSPLAAGRPSGTGTPRLQLHAEYSRSDKRQNPTTTRSTITYSTITITHSTTPPGDYEYRHVLGLQLQQVAGHHVQLTQ